MALRKEYLKNKPVRKATFILPKEAAKEANKVMATFIFPKDVAKEANKVVLVGDFNNWNIYATPMRKLKDGSFSVVIDLEPNSDYTQLGYMKLRRLESLTLLSSLDIVVEPDSDGFFCKCIDIPQVYGHGDTPLEAIDMLKRETESLYYDLMEDDNWSDDFLKLKVFLKSVVASR